MIIKSFKNPNDWILIAVHPICWGDTEAMSGYYNLGDYKYYCLAL